MGANGRCRKYRELIPLLIDGELDEATGAKVEHHINHCEVCMSEFKWQQWLRFVLRSMPYIPAPPGFTEKTLARIKQLQNQRSAISRLFNSWRQSISQLTPIPTYAFALLIIAFLGWATFKVQMTGDVFRGSEYASIAGLTQPEVEAKIKVPLKNSNGVQTDIARVNGVSPSLAHRHISPSGRPTQLLVKSTVAKSVGKRWRSSPVNPKPSSSASNVIPDRADVQPVYSSTIPVSPSSMGMPYIYTSFAYDTDANFSDLSLVEAKQLIENGKLSQAMERLRRLLQTANQGELIRYHVMCLMKICCERMGEWLFAKSISEQITTELIALKDARVIMQVAQVCESNGDAQLASELYAMVIEHGVYSTSLCAYAQTRLESLRSGRFAKAVEENRTGAQDISIGASNGGSTGASKAADLPHDKPLEANPDDFASLVEDLFKLAEII